MVHWMGEWVDREVVKWKRMCGMGTMEGLMMMVI